MSDRKLEKARDATKAEDGKARVIAQGAALSQTRQTHSNRKLRMAGIVALSVLGPVIAIVAGLYLYLGGGRYVSTDNAYVKSDKIAVSADISGRVAKVLVRANQTVTPGQLLFRIDPEPFQITVDRTSAELLAARQEGEALKSLYRQKLASLEKAKVDIAYYERRFDRQNKLKRKAIASQSTLDTAEQNLNNARAEIHVLEQDLAQVLAKLGGKLETPINRLPGVLAAAAAHKQAELDLKRTEVRSSVDGIVTNFDLQPGEYVEAGKVVFSIVGTRELWVQANFRETDLTFMRVGQVATIHIDAFPQDEREAVVASIDPATGAEFALLPPQNTTGNWVKVVQRLPVRIKLKDALRDPPLRAGMSVVVEIDTKHQRTLGGLISGIAARIGG